MYFEYEQCYITFYVLFIALPTMIQFRYIKSRRPQIFTQQIISKAINLTMIFAWSTVFFKDNIFNKFSISFKIGEAANSYDKRWCVRTMCTWSKTVLRDTCSFIHISYCCSVSTRVDSTSILTGCLGSCGLNVEEAGNL